MNINSHIDPWIIIQNNEFEKAIELIDIEFNKTQNFFLLFNKVLALFHLKRYSEALLLIEKLIEFRKGTGETQADFINLGIVYWIRGNKTEAIAAWLAAQNSMFKDAAGGIEIEIFLYFGAVKTVQDKLKANTVRAIKKLLKTKRSINWPGPLGHYLLGEITEDELFSSVVSVPILKERQLCQTQFVSAIKRLETGDTDGYYKKLKECISYGPPSYLEQMYYLAKGELEVSTHTN